MPLPEHAGSPWRPEAISFCTYPLNEAWLAEQAGECTTYAEHFFPHAAAHLVDGGVITCLGNEIDLPSRQHQRLMPGYFRSSHSTVLAISPE
jgi:hypothetical protein